MAKNTEETTNAWELYASRQPGDCEREESLLDGWPRRGRDQVQTNHLRADTAWSTSESGRMIKECH